MLAHSPPIAGGLFLLVLLGAAIHIPRCLLAAHPHFEGLDDASYAVIDDDHFDYEPSIPSPEISVSSVESPSDPLPPPPPPPPSPIADSELWDEDEFEGIPILNLISYPPDPNPDPDRVQGPAPSPSDAPAPSPWFPYTIEFTFIIFLISIVVNYLVGNRKNERIVVAWASKFATRDSIFSKNFSFRGAGDGNNAPSPLKERPDVFKIWARGRKYCKGFVATMKLKKRHNLISRIWDMVFLKRDTITFEVMMHDNAMGHVVLAVARSKASKAMLKEERDLQRFASVLAWTPAGRHWVSEELAIVAESKEVAGDLITQAVLDQVLGKKAFKKFGKEFISLHFSDQYLDSHSKTLIFKFALPDAKNMADMTMLVSLVPYYVNLIGRYKLSSQVRSRTNAARLKAAQDTSKELQNARQEALQKQNEERRKFMEEADAKFSTDAINRRQEKKHTCSKKSKPPKKLRKRHH
ncbi:Formin homology 2 domain (FH2 domain)-containing protein [Dioscorea alata]|uniref:Formin homology 2 domain (FH2 domain)-containing protein n=1 Tax=Dioscorea alata TaxID=55571 RepID=A0ACB7W0N4_DIOAL|nr:Formin homology 2 domain (FH2 domain)-containing protein [Dioscorea alata]